MRRLLRRIWPLQGPDQGNPGPTLHRPRVTLYMRPMCPLCDEVRDLILEVARDVPLDLEDFDITSDIEVYERYKWKIPVVAINGEEKLVSIIKEAPLREALRLAARSQNPGHR